MQRLRDQTEDGEPGEAELARLLQAAGPLLPSEIRKRRVLAAVQARVAAASTPEGRRAPSLTARPGLRMALAAGVLLLIGGIAGATVGRAAWDGLLSTLSGRGHRSQPAPASNPRAAVGATRAPLVPAPAPVGPLPGSSGGAPAALLPPGAPSGVLGAELAAPRASRPAVSAARNPRGPRPTPGRVPASAAAPASASRLAPTPLPIEPAPASTPLPMEDDAVTALVSSGMHALRVDHEPERARVLLEDYLNRAPDGILADDALALDIEAAASQSDPEASALARTYLKRFPNGRWVEFARKVVARSPR